MEIISSDGVKEAGICAILKFYKEQRRLVA
jgi:hypothetical protein